MNGAAASSRVAALINETAVLRGTRSKIMKRNRKLLCMLVAVIGTALITGDAQAQIGMVVSRGSFTIGGVKSTGTATIFNGDSLSTDGVSSQVHLSNGVDLTLAPHSTGAIFSDHVALHTGILSGQVGAQFRVVTQGVILQPVTPGTEAEVQVAENRVTVAIPKGQADIGNAHGALLSHMVPGQVLTYQNLNRGSDEDTHVQALGVLDREDGHYLIRDRFTNIVSELSGSIPTADLNKLVLVKGDLGTDKSTVPQVDRVVIVQSIKRSDATSDVPCQHDPGGSVANEMVVDGILSQEEGHYLVKTSDHGVVELMGNVDSSDIGKKIHTKGSIIKGQTAYAPAEQIVYTEKRKFVFSDSPCAGLITGGMLVTAGLLIHPDSGSTFADKPISF
jgi:hypothetical protein